MSSPRATFFRYLGHHKHRYLIGSSGIVAATLLTVITPRLIGQIVDALTGGTTLGFVASLALLMVVLAAFEAIVRGLGRYQILDASRRIEYEMRNDLFAHLQDMHLAYFQHQRIGDLMARMTNDLTAVRQMYGFGFVILTFTLGTLAFSVVSMLGVSARLTVLALLLTPLATISFWFIGRRVHTQFEQLQAQFGDLSTKAQENFSGIRVVKAFSQEEPEIASFATVNREYLRKAVDLARVNGLIWPSISFTLGVAVLAVLLVGGQNAIRGEMSLGQLIQFVAYLYLLSWPMVALGEVVNLFQQGWASLRRLQELFDAQPAIADPASPPPSLSITGAVEARGVSFAYDGATVLRDVSFKVPAGGSLAIVGPTGSGKSTLVNLIPRLFDVSGGEVLIDGVNVKGYPLKELRRAVGYVPQETFLFSEPLRENVAFGTDGLTDDRLEWAGDVSQLNKDVVDFTAGYDTIVGERGVTLSGGQKQRTSIARAVAKDPRILILDDALSSVDTYTEAEILRRLRGVMRERTSIVVAHRISTVKDADEILVIDEGRIAERGTHRELLELGALYARMYRRQLLEEELEVDVEQREHEDRVRSEARTEGSAARARRVEDEPELPEA